MAEGRVDDLRRLETALQFYFRASIPKLQDLSKKDVFIQPSEISAVKITLVLIVSAFMPRAGLALTQPILL